MACADIDGIRIRYDLLGAGPLLVLTPGGRFSLDEPGVRPLAERLAEFYTVLLWDRPNCGTSDIVLSGSSESEMWADVLVRLVRVVSAGPAVLAGGSAGARTTLQAAAWHPESVSAAAVWWISGGAYGTFSLGASYILPSLEAAHRGGMAAVAALAHWAGRIADNPRNADILLGQDPAEFIAIMERWLQAYVPAPGLPVAGIDDAAIRRISCPLVVVRGDRDDYNHPEAVSRHVHNLVPGSRYVEPPWSDGEWVRVTGEAAAGTLGLFGRWHELAPVLLQELARAAS